MRTRPGWGKYCSRPCANAGRRRPLEDRFFDGIGRKQSNGCIPWAKSTKNGWHGQIGRGGHACGMLVASRVAYELMVGPIPEGLNVCHSCDNPRCINPVHLFLGTQTDNLADMTAKGRRVRGNRQGGSKLTPDLVREIRSRCQKGETHQALSKEYGVCSTSISLIARRLRWRHVD